MPEKENPATTDDHAGSRRAGPWADDPAFPGRRCVREAADSHHGAGQMEEGAMASRNTNDVDGHAARGS